MTTLTIFGVLILGLAILTIGFIAKKRWLKFLSIIPLAVSGWQILRLFLMS
ncbi:hypothetical protein [Neobacillus notoginsengisoli]|uniref:hypothetical protein n=1 Tax=Neobacillus notoginsengisoli TaxID=1578198 RepID=UPI001863EC29|nr:hypothetical protein [Neobacillus notoginsengisoli]